MKWKKLASRNDGCADIDEVNEGDFTPGRNSEAVQSPHSVNITVFPKISQGD